MTFRNSFSSRSVIAYGHDILMAAISFVASLWLRLGDDTTRYLPLDTIAVGAGTVMVIGAVFFWLMGLYRGIWRYASVSDLLAITKAVSIVIPAAFLILFLWTRLDDLPRSVPIINWFVLMALLGGPRFIYRLLKDGRFNAELDSVSLRRVPVLLAGAGDGAELFIRAVSRPGEAIYRVVGILSETKARVGRNIHGIDVLGTIEDLPSVVDRFKGRPDAPQRIILTKDDIDGFRVRDLFDVATVLGLSMARIPRLTELKNGAADETGELPVREIAVEDLLGRPQKPLDRAAMRRMIEGRRVLVTGAGGSIGSELARQIVDFDPAEIVLLENSEYALYSIDLELATRSPNTLRRAVICDVRDRARLYAVVADTKPEVLFHAAALKHVPLVEANPVEGLRTNVFGTINVADAAVANGVSVIVQISTDKAVNPTNIMGASKRIAEQYIQALDVNRGPDASTRFVTVRFGNVLGSTGSVVPLFRKQLADGGPLTVTDPEMTRYFMTIREAVELVLQAAAFDETSGHVSDGRLYVLDMGKPVKIIDLARQMIRLAGFEPGKDVQIAITGVRPGEKMFEELFHSAEPPVQTDAPGILLATPRVADIETLRQNVAALAELCDSGAMTELRDAVKALVPEYSPGSS